MSIIICIFIGCVGVLLGLVVGYILGTIFQIRHCDRMHQAQVHLLENQVEQA